MLKKMIGVGVACLLLSGCVDNDTPLSNIVSEARPASSGFAEAQEMSEGVVDPVEQATDEYETIEQKTTATLFGKEVPFNVTYRIKRDTQGGFSMIVPLSVYVQLTPENDVSGYDLSVLDVKGHVTLLSDDMEYNGVEVGSFNTTFGDALLVPEQGVQSFVDMSPVGQDKVIDRQRLTAQMYHLIRSRGKLDQGYFTRRDSLTGDGPSEMMDVIDGGRISVTWNVLAKDTKSNEVYPLLVHNELKAYNKTD